MSPRSTWTRFQRQLCTVPSLGLSVDPSLMGLEQPPPARLARRVEQALDEMDALEAGAVANPDEGRMVGHYWLRAPELAPGELGRDIAETREAVKRFAAASKAREVIVVGIGGSGLGPMLVADALHAPGQRPLTVLDNTDPDGWTRALDRDLRGAVVVVISKSGGTPETRNGMLAVQRAFAAQGLDFARQAVAITQRGSKLDQEAERAGWLARFPMWDWVGGRTSVTSAVGLLPMALQGVDVDAFLDGAAEMDAATRGREPRENPAMVLATCWHQATGGKGGRRAMVVLPYKDRLVLFSRYLQQLVMESIGKQLDLRGRDVEQGLTVYGNKGSTDQHAFVQQLRDGADDFFATFLRVLEDAPAGAPLGALEVEPGVTGGDYLHGFLLGTRRALAERGRGSVTISVPRVDARTLGALVALFERAVGFYASLVGVNAYHQPGVEAGKKAAASVLALQARVAAALGATARDAAAIAKAAGEADVESVFLLLEHLAANGRARQEGFGGDARFAAARRAAPQR